MSLFSVPMELPRVDIALVDCKSASVQARWIAAQSLAMADGKLKNEAINSLVLMLNDPVFHVRAQAVEGLAQHVRMGHDISGSNVIKALDDKHEAVRCSALENIDLLVRDPANIAIKMLDDISPGVCVIALKIIGEQEADEFTNEVKSKLDHDDLFVSQEAAIALAKMGSDKGVSILCEMVKNQSSQDVEAAYCLGLLCAQSAKPVLEKIVDGWFGSVELKAMSAAALIRYPEDDLEKFISKMLRSSKSGTRMAAISALSLLPSKKMASSLGSLIENNKLEFEVSSAIYALMSLGFVEPNTAIKVLEEKKVKLSGELATEINDAIAKIKTNERN